MPNTRPFRALLLGGVLLQVATFTGTVLATEEEDICFEAFAGFKSHMYPQCHVATGFMFDSTAPIVDYDAFCGDTYCAWIYLSVRTVFDTKGVACSGNSGLDFTQKNVKDKCYKVWEAKQNETSPSPEGPPPPETPTPTPAPTPTPTPTPSPPTQDGSSAANKGGGDPSDDSGPSDDDDAGATSPSFSSPSSLSSAASSGNAMNESTEPPHLGPTSASAPLMAPIPAEGGHNGGGMDTGMLIGVVGGAIGALLIMFVFVARYRSRHARGGAPGAAASEDKDTRGFNTSSTEASGDFSNAYSNQEMRTPGARPDDHVFIEMLSSPPAMLCADDPSGYHTNEASELESLCHSDALLAVRIPLEKLTFGRFLSRGGFGEVYEGTYRTQRVAIKKLLPGKCRDRQEILDLLLEAKRMVAFQHERVVRFVGVAWDSLSELCVVSEYMTRGDLRTLLDSFDSKTEGRPHGFDDVDKVRIALHVIHGLAFLHSLEPEVLHRDLKSRNVLLDDQLNAKLTDFGVSRERTDATMTACVGTSLWMAPEVLMGSRYDAKADVFSFGVLLSELDQHVLPYAHAMEPDTDKKLSDTAIVHRVIMGLLRVAFTGDNPNGEGDASLGDSAMAQLGRECVAVAPADRPDTTEVLHRVKTEWRKLCARTMEVS